MIVPSDTDYIETTMVKRGEAGLNPDFRDLARWIEEHFSVKVLNILYDLTNGPHQKPFPRLNVVFEREGEETNFRDRRGNYDSEKQHAIADKFEKLVNRRRKLERMKDNLVAGNASSGYDTKGILVIFTCFERVAKAEANEAIAKAEIEALKNELNTSELWEISRFGATATAFFYTDQQAEKAKGSGLLEQLSTRYCRLLKKYDEFDYFDKNSFTLNVDSKENFDKNFESSWFYYYR